MTLNPKPVAESQRIRLAWIMPAIPDARPRINNPRMLKAKYVAAALPPVGWAIDADATSAATASIGRPMDSGPNIDGPMLIRTVCSEV